MSVCCECCMLSRRDLCDGLITRPEESWQLRCVVVCDLETAWTRRLWPTDGAFAPKTKSDSQNKILIIFQIRINYWPRTESYDTDANFGLQGIKFHLTNNRIFKQLKWLNFSWTNNWIFQQLKWLKFTWTNNWIFKHLKWLNFSWTNNWIFKQLKWLKFTWTNNWIFKQLKWLKFT